MINPKRFAVENGKLVESNAGNLVDYADFVNVAAHGIEGTANKEFLERQVPSLKKALIDILVIAASFEDDPEMERIKELASSALV